MNTRHDPSRSPRAPRGNTLNCKSWQTEAPFRMLQNNLDPDVAEDPAVAGGLRRHRPRRPRLGELRQDSGNAQAPGRRPDPAGAVGQAGRRVPHPPRRAARADRQLQPGAALGHVGALQRTRPQGLDDVRPDDGRLVDLHWLAGHRARHLRDLRRDGPPALQRQSEGQMDPHRGPGRHGRRAAAGGHAGRRLLPDHRMPAKAASISACAPAMSTNRRATLDDALARIAKYTAAGEAKSIALLGNAAEILPELVKRGVRPDCVTDQTSRPRPAARLPADRLDGGGMARRTARPTRRRYAMRRRNR